MDSDIRAGSTPATSIERPFWAFFCVLSTIGDLYLTLFWCQNKENVAKRATGMIVRANSTGIEGVPVIIKNVLRFIKIYIISCEK